MGNIIVEIDEDTFYEIGDIIKKVDNYEKILMVLSDAIGTGVPIRFDKEMNLMVDNIPIERVMAKWHKAGLFDIIETPTMQEAAK